MGDILSKLGQQSLFWLLVIGGAVLYGVVVTIVQAWRRIRITEIEANLKHQMLERQMSADDIERVMRASSRGSASSSESSESEESRSELIQHLAENGMSSEDIERILLALNKAPTPAVKQPAQVAG